MEWVETTAKTVDEAKERALDQLGVAGDEAEFEVVEEPKSGLFGRVRGEARVRARIRPTQVRPKHDRRGRNKPKSSESSNADTNADDLTKQGQTPPANRRRGKSQDAGPESGGKKKPKVNGRSSNKPKERNMNETEVTPQEVGDAAVAFMSGLAQAFGADANVELSIDELELEVNVDGDELGLMVGPSGRTLNAIQDLARVAAQRRLGDHETRLRVDVGGYRERRRQALEAFARKVAAEVLESGEPKALEPMASSDRKVVHDTITHVDGVESRSDGSDPTRRVVITPM